MRTIGERAVVLGAGIGGLLAARALADAYEHVTVIDRDALPAGVAPRRAVPQGQHVHALLPSGQACMEQLLPGLTRELLADGAVPYRALTELRFMVGGHWLARGDVGRDSLVASRPFIEGHVRRRVRALENVTILDRCDAAGLTTDARRRAGHRRAGPAPRAGERRRNAARRPRGSCDGPLGPAGSVAGSARLHATGRGAPGRRPRLRQRCLAAARRRPGRRQARADRRPAGPAALARAVRPGARALAADGRRLRRSSPAARAPTG